MQRRCQPHGSIRPVRVYIGFRYHKWLGKERRKCHIPPTLVVEGFIKLLRLRRSSDKRVSLPSPPTDRKNKRTKALRHHPSSTPPQRHPLELRLPGVCMRLPSAARLSLGALEQGVERRHAAWTNVSGLDRVGFRDGLRGEGLCNPGLRMPKRRPLGWGGHTHEAKH
jgi:hypothetical protein